jgi:4-hydroxy-tetrahydrodipicolinate synthase
MFSGSLVALITPFNHLNQIDEKKLRELIDWHIDAKTDGIVCCGTTGESPTLSNEEKIHVYKICVDQAKGKIPIIAGTGTYDTKTSFDLTKKAKEIGVDGCLVVAPYYNKPTQLGILAHFQQISKANLPIIVYHHPGRTGIAIEINTFIALEKIDNIVAIKEASGSVEKMLVIKDKCKLPILSGDDGLTYEMMRFGARGVISVVANIIPQKWKEMVQCCLKGKFESARDINDYYKPLVNAMFLETNPQCIKYGLSLKRNILPKMRLPLIEPSYLVKEHIKQTLQKY